MTLKRAGWLGLGLCFLAFFAAIYVYPQLPDPMPTHWDMAGRVNGYSPKAFVFLMPVIALITWALMLVLPRIAPRGYRLDGFMGAYAAVTLAMIGMFLIMSLVMLQAARGTPLHIEHLVPMSVGLLLLVIGNYMGKLRKNFFIGIRTPWTLANDEVWARTHRLGGQLMAATGLMLLLGYAVLSTPWLLIAGVVAAALGPIVYSYVLYRRLVGFEPGDDGDQ